MSPRDYDALLFDFGGVVVGIDFARAWAYWADAAGVPVSQVQARFAHGEAYERHERGEIGMAEYCAALRADLGIELDDAALTEGWQRIFLEPIEPTVMLLRKLRGRVPLYLFSNTNLAHYEYFRERFAAALEPFDRIFISNEMGLRKPEAGAFRHVAREIGVPLQRILFLDDSPVNVNGARALGMGAVLVRTPEDVHAAVSGWLDVDSIRTGS